MLDDLKRVFRDSWNSFAAEAGRRDPEDRVAELLSAMRQEMVHARAALPEYETHWRRSQAELDRERRHLDDCVRRATLAERIGDAETVRLANEYADRHRARVEVLEAKVKAAEAEHALRTRESQEMTRRYKEADANRFGLLAELRRQGAARTLRGHLGHDAGLGDDEFDRVADRIADDAAYAEALEEMSDEPPPPPRGGGDVEDRLAELKRRMGQG
jgi:phage shock protein A